MSDHGNALEQSNPLFKTVLSLLFVAITGGAVGRPIC